MKFIMSLIALAALSFVTSVFAQEEETTPSPTPADEEKASATVEEKPAATPAEEPAAQKKETSAASAEKPTAAAKKDTAAGAAPQKSASPAAAPASGKKMSTAGVLKEMENNWEAAYIKHDVAAIAAMVADDFVGVSSKGKVRNKRSLLAEIKADKDTYTSAKNEKLDVHTYDKDLAVVVGTAREKGTEKDGKAFDRTYRFTDTWLNRYGKWQCVVSHVSLLPSK